MNESRPAHEPCEARGPRRDCRSAGWARQRSNRVLSPLLLALLIMTLASFAHATSSEPGAPTGANGAGLHEAGHGGAVEHATSGHGPEPINWTQWSCGAQHATPPLLFILINFGLLVVALVKLSRKPLHTFLESRGARIETDLKAASDLRARAAAELEQIAVKLAELDRKVADIQAEAEREATAERAQILDTAKHEAAMVLAHAEKTVQQELERAHRKLEVSAIQAAFEATEKLLAEKITSADRDRWKRDYLSKLKHLGEAR